MWTKYILLGLVAARPSHGYALRDMVRTHLVGLWEPTVGQVYRLLVRLEHEGLVSGYQELVGKRPPRRVYAITPAGRDALRRWFTHPSVRTPTALGDFLTWLPFVDLFKDCLGHTSSEALVNGHIRAARRFLAELTALRAKLPAERDARRLGTLLLLEAVALQTEATINVLERAGQTLDRSAETAGAVSPSASRNGSRVDGVSRSA